MARKAKRPRAREFVLDGSVALAWCFPDERASYPQAVLDSLAHARAVVPGLWLLEVGNAWLVGERRKRCTEADTARWIGFLNRLPITVDDETATHAWGEIVRLARAHTLSTYDAAYLELAIRRGLPLATLDDRLKAATATAGVSEYVPGS
jgi:predicted nucleic acid-binding protein